MGMFDTVLVKCPNCNTINEFQSKSGECLLAVYNLENCPEDVLRDINRHSPIECNCGTKYKVGYDICITNRRTILC